MKGRVSAPNPSSEAVAPIQALCEAAVTRQAGVSVWNGSRAPGFRELCLICTTGRESSHISPGLTMGLIGWLCPRAHLLRCRGSKDTQPSIKPDRDASYSSCIVYGVSHFQEEARSRLALALRCASHFILLILSLGGRACRDSEQQRNSTEVRLKTTTARSYPWTKIMAFDVIDQECSPNMCLSSLFEWKVLRGK